MAQQGKYLKFISYLQIIGIILVVLGHSFHEYPDGEQGKTLLLYRLLYNVRMPLFTFVSGYLMYYTSFLAGRQGRGVGAFAWNKFKRLLIPFITLTLVTFLPRAAMSGMADDAIEMSWRGLGMSFADPNCLVIPFFWFLQMSFILLVTTYAVIRLGRRAPIPDGAWLWALFIFLAALPHLPVDVPGIFSLAYASKLGMYFVGGALYCRYSDSVNRVLRLSSPRTGLVAGALWVAIFLIYEGEPMARAGSFFGIAMMVCLAINMERRGVKILDHLMGANYIIFLLSWYVNVATQQVLGRLVTLPWWAHTALSLVGGIYIPWLAFKYLQRHPDSRWVRVTAFLLGQNLKRRG